MPTWNVMALSGIDAVDLDALALSNTVKLDVTLGALPGITAEGSSTFLQSRVATPNVASNPQYAAAQTQLTEAQKTAIRQVADAKGLPVEDLVPPSKPATPTAPTAPRSGGGFGLVLALGALYLLGRK